MGTGPIKGFGATLTIGVAASLFTALVVTRLIFDFLIGKGWLKSLPMLHIIRAVNLDFMKLASRRSSFRGQLLRWASDMAFTGLRRATCSGRICGR